MTTTPEQLADEIEPQGAPAPGYMLNRISVDNLKVIYRSGSATPMLAALGNSIDAIEDAKALIRTFSTQVEQLTRERDGLQARLDRAINAAQEHFGESAVRYKLSLFANGRARNVFPRDLDGRWYAFQRADNDAHVGLCDLVAKLEDELAALREQAMQKIGEAVEMSGAPAFTTCCFDARVVAPGASLFIAPSPSSAEGA